MHTIHRTSKWTTDHYGNSIRIAATADSNGVREYKSAHTEIQDYLKRQEMIKLAGMTRRTASSVCG